MKLYAPVLLAVAHVANAGSITSEAQSIATLQPLCNRGELGACQLLLKHVEKTGSRSSYADIALQTCKLGDKSACRAFLLNSEVRYASYWKNQTELIAPAPEALLELLRIDNNLENIAERPAAVQATPEFLTILRAAFKEIPASVLAVLKNKLVGIFLVNGLGSSAYNLNLFDETNRTSSALIGLDVGKLTRKANEWATWKENTPFAEDPLFKLETTIEEKRNNNIKNAIQFLLLHELGHTLEQIGSYLPAHHEIPDSKVAEKYPFLNLSWLVTRNDYVSKFDRKFPQRSRVIFYAESPEKKTSILSAEEIYKKLERTRFPSLYASSNPFDDFAESFAGYVHSVLQKRPYRVVIKKKGKIIYSLDSCWNQERCREKRVYFDKLFQGVGRHP